MNGEEMWDTVFKALSNSVIELPTIPSTNRKPLWLQAYIDNGVLFVDSAKNNMPSSNMKKRRKITKKDFLTVYPYYHRWAKGERFLRQQVRLLSRNTAYIFALIANYEKINMQI